jgi:hypothetical protein
MIPGHHAGYAAGAAGLSRRATAATMPPTSIPRITVYAIHITICGTTAISRYFR